MDSIVPNQEYLLQGSVMDSAVEVLLHRLRGLCDNVDSGPETFHDHEMCFSIRVSSLTPVQPVLLRVRRAVDYPEMPWQLRYIGQPEVVRALQNTKNQLFFLKAQVNGSSEFHHCSRFREGRWAAC
uniref:Mediator of RNA polymerase II transcription subunit 18 n=1 Tax=Timema shepardi TaxID=629360 RepID=A0A7R9BB18_TIMSH|nr:unnamed protein product [Timema shepardi]